MVGPSCQASRVGQGHFRQPLGGGERFQVPNGGGGPDDRGEYGDLVRPFPAVVFLYGGADVFEPGGDPGGPKERRVERNFRAFATVFCYDLAPELILSLLQCEAYGGPTRIRTEDQGIMSPLL